MNTSTNIGVLRQPLHSNPFRNAECAREALFDMLHDVKPVLQAKPAPVKPQRAGWLSILMSKMGVLV